eukprot:TRINITY_DN49031_c0_g1_i1.p1 TRINITY_DN49031_c0_g1~~TRINITY_DN49031_c0_g1_i1.p1  ORF type:complete len:552 (-),score=33.02 TRINITY_DN49031_c0_g1_i1:150-1805(-)
MITYVAWYVRFATLFCATKILVEVAAQANDEVPWYASVSAYHFPKIFAEDLDATNFISTLRSATAEYVLVDFYAPWCPHCQHFAPDYERLALTIRRFDDTEAKRFAMRKGHLNVSILSATLDCVRDSSFCSLWGIDSYPTLLWGKRSDWLSQDRSKLIDVDAQPRTAEAVAEWIERSSGTHIHLDPSNVSRQEIMGYMISTGSFANQSSSRDGKKGVHESVVRADSVDLWDIQLAAALLIHNSIGGRPYVQGTDDGPRAALLELLALLAKRFPSSDESGVTGTVNTCRNSLAELHAMLRSPAWWNSDEPGSFVYDYEVEGESGDSPPYVIVDIARLEQQWRLCGTDWSVYKRGWRSCRGSWPNKRGYTCGLWSLFHSLAARTDDGAASHETAVVRDAIHYFFDCQDCREHFFQIPYSGHLIRTRRDAQLWWWYAHNIVNDRVKKIEDKFMDGDLHFPKIQWPGQDRCRGCRVIAGGNNHRIAEFLARKPIRNHVADAVRVKQKHSEVPSVSRLLAEAVDQEGWVLHRVTTFLDRFYGSLPSYKSEESLEVS